MSVCSQRGEGDVHLLGAESAAGQVGREGARGGGELDHTTQLCVHTGTMHTPAVNMQCMQYVLNKK